MKMNSSLGVNLRVTGHCNQGDRKYMEDMFCVAYQQTEDGEDLEYAYFGIFDGHGGKEAAVFARERLMEFIVNEKKFWSDNDEDVLSAIKCGYLATHHAMWKELAAWPKTASGLPSTSGTTATIAFIRNGKLYIGHVGDSSLVLGYQKTPGPPHKSAWLAEPLTQDHKPESEDEINRIERSGGKVKRKSGVHRVVWNRPRIGHKGPVRRSTPIDEIPFLSVARSLGDLWSYNYDSDQFVVSPEPDVRVVKIDTSMHRCLIFGTDGFWNMISPLDAVQIAKEADRRNETQLAHPHEQLTCDNTWVNPSKCLVDRALYRWSCLRIRADNTSVVTLFLNPPCSQGGCQLSKTAIVSHNHEAEEVSEPLPVISLESMQSPVVPISPLPSVDSLLPRPALQEGSKVKSPLNDILPLLNTKRLQDFRKEKARSGSDCTSRAPEPAIPCGSSPGDGGDTRESKIVEGDLSRVDERLLPVRVRPESVSPNPKPLAASTPAYPLKVGSTYPRREAVTSERPGRMGERLKDSHVRGVKRRHSSVLDRRDGNANDQGREKKRTCSEDKSVFGEAGVEAAIRVCGSGANADAYNTEDAENERVAWPASWLAKMRPYAGGVGSNAVLNCPLRRKKKWIHDNGSPLNGLTQARPRSNDHLYLDRREHSRTLRSDTNAAALSQRRTLRSRNIEVKIPVPVLTSKVASAKRGLHARSLTSEHSPFSRSSLLQSVRAALPSTSPRRRVRSSVAHPK